MGLQVFKRGGQVLLGVLFCVLVADISLKLSEGPALALHDVQDASSIYLPHYTASASVCGLNPSPTPINICPREANMSTPVLQNLQQVNISDKISKPTQHEEVPLPTLHTHKMDDARLLVVTLAASPLDMAMLRKRRRLCSYADERCRRFTQGYSAFFLWVTWEALTISRADLGEASGVWGAVVGAWQRIKAFARQLIDKTPLFLVCIALHVQFEGGLLVVMYRAGLLLLTTGTIGLLAIGGLYGLFTLICGVFALYRGLSPLLRAVRRLVHAASPSSTNTPTSSGILSGVTTSHNAPTPRPATTPLPNTTTITTTTNAAISPATTIITNAATPLLMANHTVGSSSLNCPNRCGDLNDAIEGRGESRLDEGMPEQCDLPTRPVALCAGDSVPEARGERAQALREAEEGKEGEKEEERTEGKEEEGTEGTEGTEEREEREDAGSSSLSHHAIPAAVVAHADVSTPEAEAEGEEEEAEGSSDIRPDVMAENDVSAPEVEAEAEEREGSSTIRPAVMAQDDASLPATAEEAEVSSTSLSTVGMEISEEGGDVDVIASAEPEAMTAAAEVMPAEAALQEGPQEEWVVLPTPMVSTGEGVLVPAADVIVQHMASEVQQAAALAPQQQEGEEEGEEEESVVGLAHPPVAAAVVGPILPPDNGAVASPDNAIVSPDNDTVLPDNDQAVQDDDAMQTDGSVQGDVVTTEGEGDNEEAQPVVADAIAVATEVVPAVPLSKAQHTAILRWGMIAFQDFVMNNLDFVEEMAGGAQGRVRKFRGRGLYVHMQYVLKEMPFYDPSSNVPPDASHVAFLMATAHEEVTIWTEVGDREWTVELTKWAITEERASYLMPLCPGQQLAEALARYPGRFSLKVITGAASSFIAMLKDMQERHIVHHDLKPANCLVSTQGDMKVVDWGMSRKTSPPVPLCFRGTLGHMCPEAIFAGPHSGPLTNDVDIFACGIMLYQMAYPNQRPWSSAVHAAFGRITQRLRDEDVYPTADQYPDLLGHMHADLALMVHSLYTAMAQKRVSVQVYLHARRMLSPDPEVRRSVLAFTPDEIRAEAGVVVAELRK